MSFRDIVQEDLTNIMDDEVQYFGKTVAVKLFESLNDPGIADKGGILSYFISLSSSFPGIQRSQSLTVHGENCTIIAFRKNPNGGIVVTYSKASES